MEREKRYIIRFKDPETKPRTDSKAKKKKETGGVPFVRGRREGTPGVQCIPSSLITIRKKEGVGKGERHGVVGR